MATIEYDLPTATVESTLHKDSGVTEVAVKYKPVNGSMRMGIVYRVYLHDAERAALYNTSRDPRVPEAIEMMEPDRFYIRDPFGGAYGPYTNAESATQSILLAIREEEQKRSERV